MRNQRAPNDEPLAGVERRDGAVVVHLAGELDVYNAPAIREVLLSLCGEQPALLVVDLEQVAFLDSTVLGILIETRGKLRERHSLRIAAPGVETERALRISGLDRHLSLYDTVSAAIAADAG